MLNSIRNFSKTLFAKILLVIIIIPFVFWGMGGVFNSGNTNNIVKINNQSISTQDFIDHINTSNLNSNMIKDNIDNNILEELLGNLISQKILKMEVKNLNIHISENILVKRIKQNKNFRDDDKFSRTKYEKFLLSQNMTAPVFELKLKENELRKQLFSYVSGGIKSPSFLINNTFKDQTSKMEIDYINLERIYKKENDFSDTEIKRFINDNEDNLKQDYIDFSYVKITPQNLIGTDEFNQLFFKKIDELENNLSNGVSYESLVREIKLNSTKKNKYIIGKKNNEIEEKIYLKRKENKTQLIEEDEFYILYNISKIDKILPNINNEKFKKRITKILFNKNKYEYNQKLIESINLNKFNESNFQEFANKDSLKIENNIFDSIRDDKKFEKNSIKYLYTLGKNDFALINDDNNNTYIVKIKKIYSDNLDFNSKEFINYNNQTNIKMRDNIYSSYDYFLDSKYEVKVNQKTLERVKNYFK